VKRVLPRAGRPIVHVVHLLLAGALLGACSFEMRPASPIVGTYELAAGGCLLTVTEFGATASCDSGEVMKVTLGDDSISVDEFIMPPSTEKNTECWVERTCTKSYGGQATRKTREGDVYDGRFGRLAGTWEGKITQVVACSTAKAATGAPSYCKKTTEDVTYTYSAAVTANAATITWSSTTGAEGAFEVLETKGGIRAADEFYRRLEPGQTPTDAGTSKADKASGDK
jgi:hypothetical protein